MIILDTDRLDLLKLGLEDAPFILELLNDPQWLRFIGDKKVKTTEDARRYILGGPMESYENFGFGLFLIRLKESHTPMGICGLLKRDYLDHVDLGFALLPKFRGNGYIAESAAAVLDHGKINFHFNRVLAITQSGNINSIKALENLGFTFERTICIPGDDSEIRLYGKNL